MHNTQTYFIILQRLCVTDISQLISSPRAIYWYPLPSDWFKVNIDGAVNGCPGTLSAGGIFRISNGYSVGSFTVLLGSKFSFEAELMAAIIALRYAITVYYSPLWIESDLAFMIRLIQHKSLEVPWHLRLDWHLF